MPRDFFDPTPEQQNVVLVDAATLREAERLIESCETAIAKVQRSLSITFSTESPAQIRA